ncbi:MAG TPA: glutathione S-transferase family protein [Candidatus Limnocylindrales bacterium]|nr:glutathione S-transferase family protein [Candidatus Limnocylindrales bacterium]
MITLYGVPGSRAFRTIWMLEELGVPYENVPTHFANGDTKKPDYLALNPNGHIPTLVDDGTPYWESMAINLYLAKKYDKGLQPKSAEGEAHAIQWSFWAMTEVENPLIEVLMHRMFLPADQRNPKVAEAAVEKLQGPLGVLDRHLAGRKYVLGDQYSVADVNLASVLSWGPLVGLDLSGFPSLGKWLMECSARPAAKTASAKAMG